MIRELKSIFDRTADAYTATLRQLDALSLQICDDSIEVAELDRPVEEFLNLMQTVKLADMSASLGYVMQNAAPQILDRVTVVAEKMTEAEHENLGACAVDVLALAHQYRQIPGADVNREDSGLGSSRMAAEDLERVAFFALKNQSRGMTPATFEEIAKYAPDMALENEAHYAQLCEIFYDKLEGFAVEQASRDFTAELADRYQNLLLKFDAPSDKYPEPYVELTAKIFDRLTAAQKVRVLEGAIEGNGVLENSNYVYEIKHPLLSRFASTNVEFIDRYTHAGGAKGLLDRGSPSAQAKLSLE